MKQLMLTVGLVAMMGAAAPVDATDKDNALITILKKYESPSVNGDNGYRLGFSSGVNDIIRRLGFDPRKEPHRLNLNTVPNFKHANSNLTIGEQWVLAALNDWATKQELVAQYEGSATDYSQSLRTTYQLAVTDIGDKLKVGNFPVIAIPPERDVASPLKGALLGTLNTVGGFLPAVNALSNVYFFLDSQGGVDVPPHSPEQQRQPTADIITLEQARMRAEGKALFDAMDAENLKILAGAESNFGSLRAFALSGAFDKFDPAAKSAEALRANKTFSERVRREIWSDLIPLALEIDVYPDIKPKLNEQPCPLGPGYTEHQSGRPYLSCEMTKTANDCCGFVTWRRDLNDTRRLRPRDNQFGVAVEYAPTYYPGGFRGEFVGGNAAKYDKPYRIRTTRRYVGLVRQSDGKAISNATAAEIVQSMEFGADSVLRLPGLSKGSRLKQSGAFMTKSRARAYAGGRENDLFKYMSKTRPQVAAFLPSKLSDVNVHWAKKRLDKAVGSALSSMLAASGKFASDSVFGDANAMTGIAIPNLRLALTSKKVLDAALLRSFEQSHIENHPTFFRDTVQAFLAISRARAIFTESDSWMDEQIKYFKGLRAQLRQFETFPIDWNYPENEALTLQWKPITEGFPDNVRWPLGLEPKDYAKFMRSLDKKAPESETKVKIRDYFDARVFSAFRQSLTPLQESELQYYYAVSGSDRWTTAPSAYVGTVVDSLVDLKRQMKRKVDTLNAAVSRFEGQFEALYADWDKNSSDLRSALRSYQIANGTSPARR